LTSLDTGLGLYSSI